jgi:hypothetical protein
LGYGVVVVVGHEGAGRRHHYVVVVRQLLLLLWVREQRCWVMEWGGRKWAGGLLSLSKFGPPVRLVVVVGGEGA